jgi:hypothetical protein
MKKLLLVLLLLIAVQATFAQQTSWKEMDDFHKIMGATFHPSEEGNLQPLKTRVGELFSMAKAWKKSEAPAGYQGATVKPILQKLTEECKAIRKAVKKNQADADLKKMIANAHETFHEIMEKCKH